MQYFIFIFLVFIISPISAVVLCFGLILLKKNTYFDYSVTIIFSSLFLGLLNSQKIPESDLIFYIENFKIISNLTLIEYAFYFGKEPIFYAFNFLLYFITLGNIKIYLILFTSICYGLLGFSLLNLNKHLKFSKISFIGSLITLFFFPNLFSLSAHLMRQFLAASIIMFFLVEICLTQKKKVWLFLSAILVHTTASFFVLSYFFTRIKKFTSRQLFFSVIGMTGIFYLLFNYAYFFENLFSGFNFLSYGFRRIQQIETAIELESLDFYIMFLFLFIVSSFYISYRYLKLPSIALFLYLSTLLLIFVTINYNNSELALRFGFFLYFMLPFSFYFLFNTIHTKLPQLKVLLLLIFPLFSFWFIYKINYGVWQYKELDKLLFIGL